MPKHDGRGRWHMYEIGRSVGGRVGGMGMITGVRVR